ncbi:MAG TPA: PTS sugar transporter subunit IIA [Erysipelotrichaceae bacterium]|nr:PTS sugar transporter subunit IIA [Erysipelotrichaceae bacterium]
MSNSLICDELCELDLDVKDFNEFFDVFGKKAFDLNYIAETFVNAIKEREEKYPTALPVEPFPVAIPHSDHIHIVKPFIAPIRLKEEIDWHEMANNDNVLKVRIVFVLGFKKEAGHVEVLQTLIENFQDEEKMNKLLNAKTKEEFLSEVKTMKGLN